MKDRLLEDSVGQRTCIWIGTAGGLLQFAWLMLFIIGGLVLRFVLEALGAWPWA